MKAIVAAIDFSAVTDLVVAYAAALARGLGGKVVLVSVVIPPGIRKPQRPKLRVLTGQRRK